ncbi:hypothetical protein ON010_g5693 [Phytophthora cinnamomi]|nr:hypothetical protein ON010_g5693 [Phytophthora cinnamomi]
MKSPAPATDRAWKMRSVMSTLEKTFKEGYVLGLRVAIDEGVLPSHSKRNRTRTFMKDKPHRWGSKCVTTCCAETRYCTRVELDIGRSGDTEGSQAMDTKNGPTAVIRNIACVFRGLPYEGRRLIIGDRYYTSIPLVQPLRTMGFNYVGTMQTDRKGWCDRLNYPKKKCQARTPRGTFQRAVAKSNPGLGALMWADNTVVYFLASQVTTEATTVGAVKEVVEQATSLVQVWFNKYYKSPFLGLIDMALVNAYIIYKHLWEKKSHKRSHFNFLARLHNDLIEQTEACFTQARAAPNLVAKRPNVVQGDHKLTQTTDYRLNNGAQRLRQRQCKVCSCYKPEGKRRGGTSSYYCAPCSQGKKGLVTLCNKERGHPNNEGLVCTQIWHFVWQNGEVAPKASHIRDRAVAKE